MIKNLTLLILSLFLFQFSKAQKVTDTLLTYHDKWGRLVDNKDSATYFTMIMPEDPVTHLSAVKEYFSTGKPKFVAASKTRDWRTLYFEGPYITYYPNGKHKDISNYINNQLHGYNTQYFPNGKMYTASFIENKKAKLIECRDTSNNILAKNGNGKWVIYDDDIKHIIMQGTVTDSLRDGEWNYLNGNEVITENVFKSGEFVSGVYFDRSGNQHKYNSYEVNPCFKNGTADFFAYISKNFKFPDYDRQHNVAGKVIVTFVIEKDGTVTDVRAVRSPDEYMAQAAIDVVSNSPAWTPGIQNGQPVRVQYTIPIAIGTKSN